MAAAHPHGCDATNPCTMGWGLRAAFYGVNGSARFGCTYFKFCVLFLAKSFWAVVAAAFCLGRAHHRRRTSKENVAALRVGITRFTCRCGKISLVLKQQHYSPPLLQCVQCKRVGGVVYFSSTHC